MQIIVDIIIIIFILLCGVVGYKRGVFKQLVLCVGLILIFYLAYKFKDPVGEFFLLRLPIFDFPNLFKGVITLNIIVYQTLAFVLVLAVLLFIFDFILSITGLFEKLLRITIILGIPSKILGFIGGLLEGYVVAFVILFFLTQPAFSFQFFQDSNLSQKILTSSPVLTDITKDTVEVVKEIYALKDEKDTKVLNQKSLDIMLEHGMITYDTAKKLSDEGKINFEGIEEVLNKHKGDK
ncbi:MAG: CvpA family protein [Bacilli bacterium]